MPSPAAVSDVEARWRPLSDQETVNATAFLKDAWDLLLLRRPNLEEQVTAETVTEASVIRVLVAMVLRVLKNPDGYDQESIDDWSGRRNSLIADGVLRVTDDELAGITPTSTTATRSSVRLVVYGDA